MDTQLLINGEFVAGTETPETILNPRTGETILDLPEASADQIDAAVRGAARPSRAGRAPRRRSAPPRSCASPPGSRPRRRSSAGSRR
jgi:acyl-CoA reductase-like NAD-dependent aldehyde dehydrogenase